MYAYDMREGSETINCGYMPYYQLNVPSQPLRGGSDHRRFTVKIVLFLILGKDNFIYSIVYNFIYESK